MVINSERDQAHLEKVSETLIEQLDKLFGLHPGFRPVHAKGIMCSGTFAPSAEARLLTRAPHVQAASTEVIVRFSNFGGVPNISDKDPNASPRGFGVRFYLAPHVHTDIIGHTHNGFPTRTGEEFLELLEALNGSGKDAHKPTALDRFMTSHPKAQEFFNAPAPIPSSFARESYFAVSAFRFTNKEGASCYGRFQILPEGGNDYIDPEVAAGKSENFLFEEINERLALGPVKLNIIVEIAQDGDEVNDATVTWPADRRHVDFGTITLTATVPDDDAEAKRIIFDPIPRVDGIDPSDDPLIELRAALYLMSGRRRRAAAAK